MLMLGDCLDVMRGMDADSVDSVVTDPPYGLSFMGKDWDSQVPGPEYWSEALRVLKPGGHLLAFAGTRTQHRMAVAIENAGFEIRDMIAWVYGCLDERTEVATKDGVKPYHKTVAGDLVLCYDASTGAYSYQPILEVVEYEYEDTAYRLVGDFGEQVVSRNHRCIVERDGCEVFVYAEEAAREQQARIPILESLPELRDAFSDAQPDASGAQQDMQQGLLQRADRSGEHGRDAFGKAAGAGSRLRGVRDADLETRCLAAQGESADMQQSVQRGAARAGMEGARTQGTGELDARTRGGAGGPHDRQKQSGMEGRGDVSQPQGSVCRSEGQIRPLPAGISKHGPQGWLCDGAPAESGAGDWSAPDAGAVCPPHKPRRNGQSAGEPDALCDERGPQEVRAWRGHKTVVVRIEPFRYVGKVWCLRVPTGAFVAVRDGVAFPTGNSGFPKSQNVSKAIDKMDAADEQSQRRLRFTAWVRSTGLTSAQIDVATGTNMGGHYTTAKSQPAVMTREHLDAVRQMIGEVPEWVEREADIRSVESKNFAEREVVLERKVSDRRNDGTVVGLGHSGNADITAPSTPEAQQWDGWGTALKPALEPITVARKPLAKGNTVAKNVLAHGTGAINVDGCRVEGGAWSRPGSNAEGGVYGDYSNDTPRTNDKGRWPANLIHDGSDEVTGLFPVTTSGALTAAQQVNGGFSGTKNCYGTAATGGANEYQGNSGSAARFFYCAKASKRDRGEGNTHPTVKPTDLMRYLCRLVTPPGGTVLDPFMGSGSTGKAAVAEGFRFIGIERDEESFNTATGRIKAAEANAMINRMKQRTHQP